MTSRKDKNEIEYEITTEITVHVPSTGSTTQGTNQYMYISKQGKTYLSACPKAKRDNRMAIDENKTFMVGLCIIII